MGHELEMETETDNTRTWSWTPTPIWPWNWGAFAKYLIWHNSLYSTVRIASDISKCNF
jgi:hypothetical protein